MSTLKDMTTEAEGSLKDLAGAQTEGVAKFTPGPWQVSGVRTGAHIGNTHCDVHSIGPDGDPMVYAGYSDRTHALHLECMANARLVAAAPCLLASLKDFMENPIFHVGVGGNPIVVEKMLDRARAAIHRATGDKS